LPYLYGGVLCSKSTGINASFRPSDDQLRNFLPGFFLSGAQVGGKYGTNIRFLQAFGLTFFTGTLSFFLFAAFILIWSQFDPYFFSLYFENSDTRLNIVPFILVFFEGSATCIIIGLLMMMYVDRFRNREKD
jgi:hypothetical protein